MKQTKFQRIKCFFGFHDIKLEKIDVIYQLCFPYKESPQYKSTEWWWKCQRCKYEKRKTA